MKQKKPNLPSPHAVKIKIGSAILDIGHCPVEYQESVLKRLGVETPQVKVKVDSAEVNLEQCPKEFQEMMRKKLNLTSPQVIEVPLPEKFIRFAKQELAASKEYYLHTARFGPPMLKEFAMLVLAAAGCKVEREAGDDLIV